jgi:hypothetical protein
MPSSRAPAFQARDSASERISAGIGRGGTRVQASGAGDTGAAFKRLSADHGDALAL